MSRLGTCKHTHHLQNVRRVPGGLDYSHPHTPPQVESQTDSYACQWLATIEPLPPPIRRMHGGFILRAADCDACPLYEPASTWTGR